MKSIGVVRRIDKLGRVCLPRELRKELNLKHDDGLEVFIEGGSMILRKHAVQCSICGERDADKLKIVDSIGLCSDCIKKFL